MLSHTHLVLNEWTGTALQLRADHEPSREELHGEGGGRRTRQRGREEGGWRREERGRRAVSGEERERAHATRTS